MHPLKRRKNVNGFDNIKSQTQETAETVFEDKLK